MVKDNIIGGHGTATFITLVTNDDINNDVITYTGTLDKYDYNNKKYIQTTAVLKVDKLNKKVYFKDPNFNEFWCIIDLPASSNWVFTQWWCSWKNLDRMDYNIKRKLKPFVHTDEGNPIEEIYGATFQHNKTIRLSYDLLNPTNTKTKDLCLVFYSNIMPNNSFFMAITQVNFEIDIENLKYNMRFMSNGSIADKYMQGGNKKLRKGSYETMTVNELKQRCIKRGIKHNGLKKSEIIVLLRRK